VFDSESHIDVDPEQSEFERHATHFPTFGPFNAQRDVSPEQSLFD